ncbi:hypothetical protein [Ereboglobus sp. PH5-10]|uniref:hypothetical protein n=1 Tax=Ereboglobus sp. PH5-10 TaxID=2940629 RepID=UPI0024066516|nr:hypothetical protein [Ereboglobus sp. PH5-10]
MSAAKTALALKAEVKALFDAYSNSNFFEAMKDVRNFSGISSLTKFKTAHPEAADFLNKKMRPAFEAFRIKAGIPAIVNPLNTSGAEKHRAIEAKVKLEWTELGKTLAILDKITW